MKALRLTTLKGPSGLELVELPSPVGERLVHLAVSAAGVNYPDLLLMKGEYQDRVEPPFVPGAEVAGTVISAPVGSRWSPGDRVMAPRGIGGYAEEVAVPPERVLATTGCFCATSACWARAGARLCGRTRPCSRQCPRGSPTWCPVDSDRP